MTLELTSAERAALAEHLAVSASSALPSHENVTADYPPSNAPLPQPSLVTLPRQSPPARSRELPALAHRENLLRTVRESRVTLVRGATGCGKSTQLPRLLLLDAAESQSKCSIVVAQPRRLAAMALAERVAYELGDPKVGGVCGYRIRGEVRASAQTALTFVTTGVLLRQLEADPTLSSVTHLVVDEVHERNVDTDLLLLVLRRALAANTQAKIILMSATVDPAPFVRYFSSASDTTSEGTKVGVVDIPGRAFPVEELYLEDAIAHTGYSCSQAYARGKPLPSEPTQGTASRAAAEAREAAAAAAAATGIAAINLSERAAKLANAAAAVDASKAIGGPATEWLSELGAAATTVAYGATTATALRSMDFGLINDDLIEALILRHQTQNSGRDGAVLVFLPGVAEIERLAERLERAARESRSSPLVHVVRLHSQLAPAEQRAAFAPAPQAAQIKVVLATDIAETSITIDDVTLVIDAGQHRAPAIEPGSGILHLRTARISLAAAKQRAGRAGRVREGTCYHLYCHTETTRGMAAAPTAEILRVPLEATVLRLHALFDGRRAQPLPSAALATAGISASAVLATALEPPAPEAVAGAVRTLCNLGALQRCGASSEVDKGKARSEGAKGGGPRGPRGGVDRGGACPTGDGEALTPLGARLARLPTSPNLGKPLLCAHALGCLDEVSLIVAAHEAARDPFGGSKSEAGAARRALDATSCHLALIRAHGEWSASSNESERRRIADQLGVNGAALKEITRAAARLRDSVISACDGGLGRRHASAEPSAAETSQGGASNAALAKACLLCGGAALVTRARGGGKKPLELAWRSGKTELVLRPHAATVLGHSGGSTGSGGGSRAPRGDQICVSLGAMRSASGLVALDVTLVTPLAVLLFAGGLPVLDVPALDDIDDCGSSPADGCGQQVLVDVAGHQLALAAEDFRRVAALRRHLDLTLSQAPPDLPTRAQGTSVTSALHEPTAATSSDGASATPASHPPAPSAASASLRSLRRALGALLASMDVPWAGLPDGWSCENDAAGAFLFRSRLDRSYVTRQKPTQTAARVAASIEAGKGSLERANAEHAAKQKERAAARAEADAEAQAAAAVRREATREEDEAREAAEAAAAAARRAEESAALREKTLAVAAAAEAAEMTSRRKAGVEGSLGQGVSGLLAELDLTDKYTAAFAAAGYDDAALLEIAQAIDDDRDEGTQEGAEALDAMIEAVGLRGGSAVKVRKRMLEPPKKGGGGKGRGGKGGGTGSGGGRDGGGGGGRGRGSGGGGGREKDGGGGGRANGAKGGGRASKGGRGAGQ